MSVALLSSPRLASRGVAWRGAGVVLELDGGGLCAVCVVVWCCVGLLLFVSAVLI